MLRLLLNNMQRGAASVLRAGTGLNRGVQQSTAFEGFLLRNIRIGNLNETGIVGTGAKPFSTKARLHMEETQKVARRKAVENASYLVSLSFVIEFLSRFSLSIYLSLRLLHFGGALVLTSQYFFLFLFPSKMFSLTKTDCSCDRHGGFDVCLGPLVSHVLPGNGVWWNHSEGTNTRRKAQ